MMVPKAYTLIFSQAGDTQLRCFLLISGGGLSYSSQSGPWPPGQIVDTLQGTVLPAFFGCCVLSMFKVGQAVMASRLGVLNACST